MKYRYSQYEDFENLFRIEVFDEHYASVMPELDSFTVSENTYCQTFQ